MAEQSCHTLSEEISLTEILKSAEFELPMVVQTCGNAKFHGKPYDTDTVLPVDTIIKLEKEILVSYAHLKVMILESNEETIEKHGPEFTDEYKGFVGEDILIPLNYPGTMKMIHPPRQSRRYAEISQIIEDLPRYIRFETDTVSAPLPSQTSGGTVKKGTEVEVTGVINSEDDSMQYLECTAKNIKNKQKYMFPCDKLVNCTAIPDDNTYTLSEVLRSSVLLPKAVKFERDITIDDVVASCSTWANNTLVMTYGSMQLLGVEHRRFLIGWLRNDLTTTDIFRPNEKPHFIVTLIPESRLDTEMVKVLRFSTNDSEQAFMEKKFPKCEDPRCVYEKLYIMRQNETFVTWLNSDIVMEKEIIDQPTEEDDSDEYIYPAPPIPPRKPVIKDNPEVEQEKTHQAILGKVTDRMKLGFGQVHRQLAFLLKRKDKSQISPRKSDSDKTHVSSRNPDPDEPQVAPRKPKAIERQTSRPLPDIPSVSDMIEEDQSQLYDIISEKLTISDEQGIMKENQTTEDFCKYSVKQVSEIFRACAMDDFAAKCRELTLDGAFLASYKLEDLINEPFYLSPFKVTKVKLIIHNGWRPSYESQNKT